MPFIELPLHPLLERGHPWSALLLMQLQPSLSVEACGARLGIRLVHLAKLLEHEAHLIREAVGERDELAPPVGDTGRHQRFELSGVSIAR